MSSLSRGLEILEFVASHQSKGVAYPQILSHTGFPASSCFRILKELVERICIYPDGRMKIIWNFSDEVSELLKQDLAPVQEAAG